MTYRRRKIRCHNRVTCCQILTEEGSFQVASSSAAVLREEIGGDALGGKVYRPPALLRKRKEFLYDENEKPLEPNMEATGVELHKDSKFFASWSVP